MNDDSGRPLRGAIAAMTKSHVIGVGGGLPWHYPEDFKRFKRITSDSTIIMGRLTWESIGCKPLPQRNNVVISRKGVSNVAYFPSVEKAIQTYSDENIWVIGGGQIYRAAMPWLTLLDITYVPDRVNDPEAVTFPTFSRKDWRIAETVHSRDSLLYTVIFHRRSSRSSNQVCYK